MWYANWEYYQYSYLSTTIWNKVYSCRIIYLWKQLDLSSKKKTNKLTSSFTGGSTEWSHKLHNIQSMHLLVFSLTIRRIPTISNWCLYILRHRIIQSCNTNKLITRKNFAMLHKKYQKKTLVDCNCFRNYALQFLSIQTTKTISNHRMNKTQHTWSNEAIPASNCVRLTSSITSNPLIPHSGLYRISMAVLTIPISTIFRAKSEFCERFTRASATGSDTSYIYTKPNLYYSTSLLNKD